MSPGHPWGFSAMALSGNPNSPGELGTSAQKPVPKVPFLAQVPLCHPSYDQGLGVRSWVLVPAGSGGEPGARPAALGTAASCHLQRGTRVWQHLCKLRALLPARQPHPAVIAATHTGDSSIIRQLRLRCFGESAHRKGFAQG